MQGLLRALEARRLDRIAAAYVVAGWLIVQVAAIVLPSFDAPPSVMRGCIIFILAGFPFTLAWAWFAHPHITAATRTAEDRQIKPLHLAALGVFGVIIVAAVADLAYQFSRVGAQGTETASGSVAPIPTDASIAVLPFVNMSGDPSKEYFSDGISEELLNDLADVRELRVAARTSSFAFKGKNEDVKEIARTLAVRTILVGSVRQSGNHIRITAQLINAANGYYLWSDRYDRSLTDVLAVEDEIAKAITAALTHELLGSKDRQSAGKPRQIDPQAHDAYLKGQQELGPRTEQGATKALALFQEVTARQPDYADAFAAEARAYINLSEYHADRPDLIPAAEAALQRALTLDPNNMGALASHLDLALHKLDWTAASADAKKLEGLKANSTTALHEMFRYYQLLGFPELALAAAKGAAKLDPLSFVDHMNVAAALLHLARYADAGVAAQQALGLEHEQSFVLAMLCTADAHSGKLPEAKRIEKKLEGMNAKSDLAGCQFDIATGEGRGVDAKRIMDQLAAQFPTGDLGATDLGEEYAIAGAYPDATKWFDKAYQTKEFGLFTIPYDAEIAAAFFQTPGWKEIIGRPLFKDWQQAHDKVAGELAADQ